MNVCVEVNDAIARVDSYEVPPEEFELPIGEVLLDEVGIYMAIVTDRVLKRGWEPNGYEQRHGYRIYRYKRME